MKIKIITLIIAILIIAMYVPVYAETPIPDPPYDGGDYWVVADRTYDGKTMLYTSYSPINVTISEGKYKLHIRGYRNYELINGQWSFDGRGIATVLASFSTIYKANHDIAYLDGSGVFFSPQRALHQVARQMKEEGTFGTILRNFSAGLIPVVGLLILAISLRKGWAFLQGQLTH